MVSRATATYTLLLFLRSVIISTTKEMMKKFYENELQGCQFLLVQMLKTKIK